MSVNDINSIDYLVSYHITTGGKQGDDLGTDESGIVLITIAIFDVALSQFLQLEQYPVSINAELPTLANADCTKYLSNECCEETGLTEEIFETAKPLKLILQEIDQSLNGRTNNQKPPSQFVIVTDGQTPLRLTLHPQTNRENVDVQNMDYYFRFIDLRKEYKLCFKKEKLLNIEEMIQDCHIHVTTNEENYGKLQCHKMLEIIRKLSNEGHKWNNFEYICKHYNSAIVKKTDYVPDDVVVRARGLPWQATDTDISRFFRGLNIEKGGIALVLSKVGRRNGEALIRFETRDHRDLALRKHKHHMGQRYIEVYMATGRDFIQIAGGETEEAETFLRKLQSPTQSLIRMRGLPYTATVQQILAFFESANCQVDCGEEGILFVNHSDGRATGDAFVIFGSEAEAEEALKSHRENMGNRYIELFKSTPAEVNQVMNSVLHPMIPSPNQIHPSLANPATLFDDTSLFSPMPLATANGIIPLMPQLHTQAFSQGPGAFPMVTNLEQLYSPGQLFVRIVGMPLDANVADIIGFLDQFSQYISIQGVHIVYNNLGQAAGEAIVQMNNEQAALATVETKNHQLFTVMSGKKSMVELTALSSWDLTHFTGFIQSPPHNPLQNALFQLQFQQKQMSPTTIPGITINHLAYPNCWPILSPTVPQHNGNPHLNGPANQLNLMNSYICSLPPVQPHPLTVTSGASSQHLHYHQAHQTHHQSLHPLTNVTQTIATPLVAGNNPLNQINAPNQYQHHSHPQNLLLATSASSSPGTATVFIPNLNFIQPNQEFAVVIIKNLPKDVTGDEILNVFEATLRQGVGISDVKVGMGQDGSPTGEAFITFSSRNDAERSVNECTNKFVRSNPIDMALY